MTTSPRFATLAGYLQADPDNTSLLADAADAATREGHAAQAQALIARGIALEGETPEWLFRRATACMAAREFDAAHATLAALEAAGHGVPAVQHNLAYVALEQGHLAEARARLEPLLGSDPSATPEWASVLWMRCLHHEGALDAAWEFFQAAGKGAGALAPQAAVVALDRGDLPAAGRLAAEVLARDADNAQGLLVAGALKAAQGQWQDAAMRLRALTGRHPHQPRGWVLLGLVQLALGDAAQARASMEGALALQDDPQARLGLAWAHVLGGEPARAEAVFTHILVGDAQSAEALCGLGIVEAMQGRRDAAQQALARLEAIEPEGTATTLLRQVIDGDRAQLAAFAARLAAQMAASAV